MLVAHEDKKPHLQHLFAVLVVGDSALSSRSALSGISSSM